MKKLLWFLLALASALACWLAFYFAKAATPLPLPAGSVIYDVTQLNPVPVRQVISPTSEAQIRQLLLEHPGRISIGGGRYSQGGHTALRDEIQLDLRQFNQVLSFDPARKQIRVQAGIRWRDLQSYIDAENLAVQVMQTYANFTVGGSVSVNAHGRYIGQGALVHSILALRLMLADGTVLALSPAAQPDIFYAVIGGYGGLGIILDVTLQLTDNSRVKRDSQLLAVAQYRHWFEQQVKPDPTVVFHNADLYPPDFTALRAVSWRQTTEPVTEPARLHPLDADYRLQARLADFAADYRAGKWLRQFVADPLLYRQSAVHWRNYEASYDVAELEPAHRTDQTYALREYFVPVAAFEPFVAQMAAIFQQHQVNVLNVSVRHAKADPLTLLSWSPTEVFAFVVYYRQGTDAASQAAVGRWSRAMVDAAHAQGGRYYLPYQPSATPAQFARAYPGIAEFRRLKQQLDPHQRFSNSFWQQYLSAEP